MKKAILLTLASSVVLATNTFASDVVVQPVATPQEVPVVSGDDTLANPLSNTLMQKYDVIIRNNTIVSDDEYNSQNYYTKKLLVNDLVIPDEIREKAKKIYFLVEEWYPMMYMKAEAVAMDSVSTVPVQTEYNYKVVEYVEWKTEYVFNSSDLVKDFSKDMYKNVNISLIAEFSDTDKLYLANMSYVSIYDKASILETLKNQKESSGYTYYGYYDSTSLETYLEKVSEKMARADYKKVLTNAQTKLKSLITKNEQARKDILASIQQESDFAAKVEKYTLYSETSGLLNAVTTATTSQLQKLRSYDLIDSVFNK